MQRKNSIGLFITVGVLAILVLLLLVLVAVLLFGEKGEKQGGTGNAGPFVVDESTEEDTTNVAEKEKHVFTIVIDGFKFQIPSDYGCMYADEIGPVVYLDDVFQMKIEVQDIMYEEIMKNPDSVTEKTIESGGKIKQELKEIEFEGKKYAYFRMELQSNKCFVVYTEESETDKRFAGNIVIQKEDLSDEDLLHIFSGVISSAQKTEEPNSTKNDILAQIAEQITVENRKPGEEKEESIMRLEEEEAAFLVPEDFYSNGQYVKEDFVSGDLAVYVYCSLQQAVKESGFESAQACIETEREYLLESVRDETEIQTIDINGKSFYYIAVHYKYAGSDVQRIYAACDIGENAIYKVEANALDEDVELSIDTIRDFMVLK